MTLVTQFTPPYPLGYFQCFPVFRFQVSDKERQAQNEALFKEVATQVADKCVNPESKRPYPVSMIEKAMKECHVALKPNRNAKQQVPDTVAKLKTQLPIERAQMRVRLTFPVTSNK